MLNALVASYDPDATPAVADRLLAVLTYPKGGDALHLPFYAVLYNLVVKLSASKFGTPRDTVSRLRYFDACGLLSPLRPAGLPLSLNQLENGLLRRNRLAPYHRRPCLTPEEAKDVGPYMSEVVDMRLHACLNCGATSCPPVMGYHGEEDVEVAWGAFMEGAVVVEGDGVGMSLILKWYKEVR